MTSVQLQEAPPILVLDTTGVVRPPVSTDDVDTAWEGDARIYAHRVQVGDEAWTVAYRFDRAMPSDEQVRVLRSVETEGGGLVFIGPEAGSHAVARLMSDGSPENGAVAVAVVKTVAGWCEEQVSVLLYGVTYRIDLAHGTDGWVVVAPVNKTAAVERSDIPGLSADSLRSTYNPPERYRVSCHRHEPGTRFPGSCKFGRLYVISGTCTYGFDDQSVRVTAGEVLSFPSGDFTFAVVGERPCHVGQVWDLAELAPAVFATATLKPSSTSL